MVEPARAEELRTICQEQAVRLTPGFAGLEVAEIEQVRSALSEIPALLDEIDTLTREIHSVYKLNQEKRFHVAYCNGSNFGEVGNSTCNCPLGYDLKDLRYKLAQAQGKLAAPPSQG